ncbi:cytochrome P450 [Ephemerocybe angulata]|uniref:Cytochrome P450 n=1 Tax=Ephemerocybe angulata TaxID=980116 RepID=A0A8H6M2B9_9AGAR|nr:cytochrome P450 [Tulosesus angulatus]
MTTTTELVITAAIGYALYQFLSFYYIRAKISHIPTIGSDSFIGSYFSAWKLLFSDDSHIKAGYRKYAGQAFKMPNLTTSSRWLIVVNGNQLVDELRKAPSDALSFNETTLDVLQFDHLLGRHAHVPEFQVEVVRKQLTRAFSGRFAEIQDEIQESCNTYLPNGPEWKGLQAHKTLIHIVCRTTNRLFVGLPLCREPEYRQIQEDWTIQIMVTAHIVHMFPSILKPLVGKTISKVKTAAKKVEKFIGPTINERLEKYERLGEDWEGKPNDLITWLLDLAPQENRNVEDITVKLMLINFAAIHTTSLTLANALFDLASRPEYIKPLREEMEEIVKMHGWTKDAMGRMWKTDSFMKESSRMAGVGAISLGRKAVKDFTFSNGLTIPAGYTVATSSAGIHYDPNIYEDPDTFNGFRFSDMREKGSNEYDPLRHQMVSLDSTYLLFGHGRHACPGRFFAVNEVKAMLAHIVINYDIKLPGGSREIPRGSWFAGSRAPHSTAEILFRKRQIE